jgi:DNA-binding transcriptional LysR family regulator
VSTAPVPDVMLGPSSQLLDALGRGELDAAVVSLPLDREDLESLSLASTCLHAAMRHDDRLAQATALSLADLSHRTVAIPAPEPQPVAIRRLRRQLEEHGLTQLRELPPDMLLLAAYVRHSDAVAFAPSPRASGACCVFADPAFAVVPLADPPDFHLGLAWRRHDHPSAILDALLAAVRAQWGGHEITP